MVKICVFVVILQSNKFYFVIRTEMKTKILLLALILFGSAGNTILIYCQNQNPSLSTNPVAENSFLKRINVGGNLGFQVGSITGITISPEARIRTVDELYVGLRFIYQYYNYKNYFYDLYNQKYLSYGSNVLGGGVYARYYLRSLFDTFLGNLFAHAEYEYMTYSRPYTQCDPSEGTITDPYLFYYKPGKQIIEINSFFVGGGYSQPVSNRVYMDFLILFNLNDSYNSPYTNPVFRLGVGVGL